MSDERTYTAADGHEITEGMIDRWCASYEAGEFPAGERTVGGVVRGRPPLSRDNDKTAVLTIKMPAGMKAAIVKKASDEGLSASAYARDVLASDLMSA